VLAALVAWREDAAPPGKIIGAHYVNDEQSQGIAFQRPLCPYPENARYKGSGNVNMASSFRCAAGDPVRSQKFGKGYGPY
jgi:feruloyl esterase